MIKANLHIRKLPEPIVINTATPSLDSRSSLTDFVYVQLHDINNLFSARHTLMSLQALYTQNSRI